MAKANKTQPTKDQYKIYLWAISVNNEMGLVNICLLQLLIISDREVMFLLAFVCLLAGVQQNYPTDCMSQNSVERWHMSHGRNR